MATVAVHCPRCDSDAIYRHGLSPTRRERFRCQYCHRVFLLTYRYEARKPKKVALVACVRKLLPILNAMFRKSEKVG